MNLKHFTLSTALASVFVVTAAAQPADTKSEAPLRMTDEARHLHIVQRAAGALKIFRAMARREPPGDDRDDFLSRVKVYEDLLRVTPPDGREAQFRGNTTRMVHELERDLLWHNASDLYR